MLNYFPKTLRHIESLNLSASDPLDRKVNELIQGEAVYERASQALRRRFVRGAHEVDGVDRGGRLTKIKRDVAGGKYKYFLQGADGNWAEPDERIWIVAMYALWQELK